MIGRTLIIAGLVLLGLGLLLYLGPSVPLLGKLPGDIRIERPSLHVYFPITSCIVISALLSLAFWLFSKF